MIWHLEALAIIADGLQRELREEAAGVQLADAIGGDNRSAWKLVRAVTCRVSARLDAVLRLVHLGRRLAAEVNL